MGTTTWPYALNAWSGRFPVMAAGTAAAGPYFVVVVPQTDALWDNLQADGDDLRAYRLGAAVDYENDAPNTTTRTIGNFNVEATDITSATKDYLYWIYHGNSAATNAEGTVTKTTLVGHLLGINYPDPARTILCVPDPPGATVPAQRVSKKKDEEMVLWWDLTPALGERLPQAGRPASHWELSYIDWHATTGTGMYSASGATRESTYSSGVGSARVTEIDGRLYVGFALLAGVATSGTDYVAKLRGQLVQDSSGIYGATNTVFEYRALVQVRNPTE